MIQNRLKKRRKKWQGFQKRVKLNLQGHNGNAGVKAKMFIKTIAQKHKQN